jgi:tetratricopeptide (TPR) repeat protein
MDCAAGNFLCYFDVIRLNAGELLPVLRDTIGSLTDLFNGLVDTVKPHLNALIALGSFAFAVWKWVRYRESALFRRFRELVEKTVRGLRAGRSDLLEIVCRPAPGQTATAPLFAENALRRVFLRRRWRLVLSSADPITSTDRLLDRALQQIDKQIEWCEMREAVFREQRATVHLLKGAIASARSERAKSAQSWWKLNNEALTHFRDALGVRGNEGDVEAAEYKAHQLRKLGELDAALACYEEMERLAGTIEAPRRKSFVLARTKRYQAEICRLQVPPALGVANRLLTSGLQEDLAPYAPLIDRDLLDQAQMHELQGCVRFGLNFNDAARQSLLAAQADFQRLVDNLDSQNLSRRKQAWRWFRSFFHDDGVEAMRAAAQAGLTRVERALQTGRCDDRVASSGRDQSNNHTKSIGSGRSAESGEETA